MFMCVYWLLFCKEYFEFRPDIEDEWLNGHTIIIPRDPEYI